MIHDFFHVPIALENYAPLEVRLMTPDNFLKVKETLTRIGVESKVGETLYQSCHILHKRGHYFIMSFKELFALDGKPVDITHNDIERRNTIAQLLAEWNLIEIVNLSAMKTFAPISQIKVLPFSEKKDWVLVSKYNVGSKPPKRPLTNDTL
jgi:hypothetical protein